jgi:hypothetical protein
MDAILDMQIKKDHKFFAAPDARYPQAVYRHTGPMSLFRKYAAKGVLYFLAKNVGSMKRVQVLLPENAGFCADFLKYLELCAVHLPSDILQCEFHHHGKDEPCHLGYKNASGDSEVEEDELRAEVLSLSD